MNNITDTLSMFYDAAKPATIFGGDYFNLTYKSPYPFTNNTNYGQIMETLKQHAERELRSAEAATTTIENEIINLAEKSGNVFDTDAEDILERRLNAAKERLGKAASKETALIEIINTIKKFEKDLA